MSMLLRNTLQALAKITLQDAIIVSGYSLFMGRCAQCYFRYCLRDWRLELIFVAGMLL